MKQLIIKSILFSIILIFILYEFDSWFLKHESKHVTSVTTIYETEKTPVDVIFLGNSHLFEGVQAEIVDAKCGLNSMIVFGGGLNIVQVYYNLIETLKYHNPKLVVLDTWPIFGPSDLSNDPYRSGHLRHNSFGDEYTKRFGFNKYDEIRLTHPENSYYHMFNFFRYHERWKDNEAWAVSLETKFSKSIDQRLIHAGINQSILDSKKNEVFKKKKFSSEKICLTETENQYILKIINLLKSKQCDVLFINVPFLDTYYKHTEVAFNEISDELSGLIANQKHVQFYDINRMLGGLDYKHIVNEPTVQVSQHLNYQGAVITSNLVSNYINKNYQFEGTKYDGLPTPEQYIYAADSFKKSLDFSAEIIEINGTVVSDSVLSISRKENSHLIIKGKMKMTGIHNTKATQIIGLKKNNDFVYISRQGLKLTKTNEKDSDGSYIYKLNTKLLPSGTYSISNFLRLKDDRLVMMDNLAWFRLE